MGLSPAEQIRELEAEIRRLRGALEFYADERNWERKEVFRCGDGCCTDYADNIEVYEDAGEQAREALQAKNRGAT